MGQLRSSKFKVGDIVCIGMSLGTQIYYSGVIKEEVRFGGYDWVVTFRNDELYDVHVFENELLIRDCDNCRRKFICYTDTYLS